MGTIASDFYSRFGSIDIVEAPFTVEELMNMASVEVQGRYAAWTAENGDAGYIPAEILLALLEDRAAAFGKNARPFFMIQKDG